MKGSAVMFNVPKAKRVTKINSKNHNSSAYIDPDYYPKAFKNFVKRMKRRGIKIG